MVIKKDHNKSMGPELSMGNQKLKGSSNNNHKVNKTSKASLNISKRKSRLQDSTLGLESSGKVPLNKSYNRTKRFDKCSFDSDFMNSSQSIKFGMTGGSFEDNMEMNKNKQSKFFVYKKSRMNKIVNNSINKSFKEDKNLKRIKEVEENHSKSTQQTRLKNSKKSKKSIGRNKNEPDFLNEANKTNTVSKSSFQNPRAWREFFEVRKEINAMNEKVFMSTDSVINNKGNKMPKAGLSKTFLKKSGSVDSNSNDSLMQEILNETDGK